MIACPSDEFQGVRVVDQHVEKRVRLTFKSEGVAGGVIADQAARV